MSEITRRFLLQTTSAALTVLPAAAQTRHHETAEMPVQSPAVRYLQPQEFATLQTLCDIIIPADDHSPGARASGAAEYIDLLARGNPKIAEIYHGGLAWLNSRAISLYGEPFTGISDSQAISLVEQIADLDHVEPNVKYGAIFFDWARRMTMDAFYTSPAGIADIGYIGNKGMTTYQVPPEALDQALRRLNEKS
jgi:hypothetical protein